MSTSPQLRVGDIGKSIRVRVLDTDISLATVLTMKLRAPSGTVLEKTATLVTDGTDGRLEYVTVSGDLTESGPWIGQAYVVTPTITFHTTLFAFPVASNLS